ncbi:peptidoglycan-binding protein [Streptomyces sp. NPDC060002]|uniref:peptidoglycan-binding domain-containing protein n=1 Tax=Streptomyces sp. NPDC060002 TaxID=3347033 RepID=UPI0036BE08CB
MIDPTGHQGRSGQQGLPCPECGVLRALDNTPSCACARRASDAQRDTRTTEAAAAEDFDPLRIRPYVELGTEAGGEPAGTFGDEPGATFGARAAGNFGAGAAGNFGAGAAGNFGAGAAGNFGAGAAGTFEAPAAGTFEGEPGATFGARAAGNFGAGAAGTFGGEPEATFGAGAAGTFGSEPGATFEAGAAGNFGAGASGSADAADVTMPLPTVPAAPAASAVPAVPADATMPLRTVHPTGPAPDMTAALPTPLASSASEPSTTDLSLFEAAVVGVAHPDDEEPHRPRRRRTLLIATTAAVVAVVAAAGFASGLFTYEKPTRDGATPEDVRAAVPDASTSAASASASPSRSASPSASEASPSPSESESPSPSPSESSASPSASPSAEAGQATPTARATGSLAPGNGADNEDDPTDAVVLRRGDTGAEVTELQLRLRQLFLYNGEADGTFTAEVEDALRNYQWSRGTTEDGMGVYGSLTRARLESETTEP